MARGNTPSAAKGGKPLQSAALRETAADSSPGGGAKKRKNDITVVGFMILEDGRKVPMEDLTPEQREAWKRSCCERLSQRLSDYFTQHPEEYARF